MWERIKRSLIEPDIIRTIGESEDRTAELSFSSETPIRGKHGLECLDHSKNAVDLRQLLAGGVVLFNHDENQIVGGVLEAAVQNGRGVARVRFARTALGNEAWELVQDGILRGISVGAIVEQWEKVRRGDTSRDGRFKGPCYVARSWWPFEISLCPVPADISVGVGRSLELGGALSRTMCENIYTYNQNFTEAGGKRNEQG